MNPNTRNVFNKYHAIALVASASALSSFAVLPSYVTAAITDSQTQLTELVAAMVPAAIVLVLLALTPRVLLKMIRGLGSKVNF